MNKRLEKDLNQFDDLLNKVKNRSCEFLNTLEQRPTSAPNSVKSDAYIPSKGIGTKETLALFLEKFDTSIVSSSGPRYWGFVTGGSTPASIAGDWLASVYDQNTQSVNGHGDISAVIEIETIKMFLEFFDLSDDFLGGFVTGATMSNFTCLGVARQWLGKEFGLDIAKQGMLKQMKVLSATPHSSAVKSLGMLGMGSNSIIKVQTLPDNREAIDMKDLEKQIVSLKEEPFILISSAGTVNSADFDDFVQINKLKQKYNFWWHIDAAFGGFATCSSKYKHLVKDWEFADSITIDNHKWLNVPYESAFYLIKEKYKYLQIETFQNSNAPYLGDPLENFNYLNFLPENSRRLRALPAWFTLMAYGKEGYKDIVENSVDMAQKFGSFINKSEDFELLCPVRLNTVCFTLSNNHEEASAFLNELNASGKVFMTPTVYNDKNGIRAAFVNYRTTQADLEIVMDEMNEILKNK